MTYIEKNGRREKVKGSTLYWFVWVGRLKNNPHGTTRVSIIKDRIKKAIEREFKDELVK